MLAAAAPAGFPALLRGRRPAAAAPRAVILAALVLAVDRPPGPLLGFLGRHAPVLISFGDMVGLAFLLGRIGTFRHGSSPLHENAAINARARRPCRCCVAA